MIRVPRRTPERIIPIQFDTKISAVKKALQQTVQHVETEMTSEEVHQELVKEQITPVKKIFVYLFCLHFLFTFFVYILMFTF